MTSFLVICTNRTIFGDALVDPVRTHAKKVEELFDPVDSISEVALRIIKALALLIALPATALLYLVAGIGLSIKCVWVYGVLSNDLSRLSQKLEALYDRLSSKEAVFNLKNQAVEFANTYRNTLLSPGFSQQRNTFNWIVSTLQELLKIPPRFFYKIPNSDGMIEVPSDGNCLFHAAVAGLTLDISHEDLRAECVKWEREHLKTDSSLSAYIGSAILSYKESRINQLQEQKKSLEEILKTDAAGKNQLQKLDQKIDEIEREELTCESYLDLLAKPSFYGSDAEIYAISQLYSVKVEIESISGITSQIFSVGEGEGVLRLVHVRGDHFNVRTSPR